jgi:hypothetical protein
MPQLRKGNRLFPLPALTLRSCVLTFAITALAAVAPLGAQPTCTTPPGTPDKPAVLTAQYDIQRDAHNADETWLNYGNETIITSTSGGNGCLTQIAFLQVDVADLPLPSSGDAAFLSKRLRTTGRSPSCARTEGNIYIYNAIPNSGLAALWTTDSTNKSPGVAQCGANCQTFCASSFALPTRSGPIRP